MEPRYNLSLSAIYANGSSFSVHSLTLISELQSQPDLAAATTIVPKHNGRTGFWRQDSVVSNIQLMWIWRGLGLVRNNHLLINRCRRIGKSTTRRGGGVQPLLLHRRTYRLYRVAGDPRVCSKRCTWLSWFFWMLSSSISFLKRRVLLFTETNLQV